MFSLGLGVSLFWELWVKEGLLGVTQFSGGLGDWFLLG